LRRTFGSAALLAISTFMGNEQFKKSPTDFLAVSNGFAQIGHCSLGHSKTA